VLAISTSDFLWFVDQALDEMVSIVRQLGDDTASTRPDLAGANSPYAILAHCLGVMEFWGGYMVAGRPIERDRDAEFRAEGPVAELVERAAEARRRLEADIAAADPLAAPRHDPLFPEDAETPIGRTQGGVLVHLFVELTQHLGQMQLTRDVLLRGSVAPS
jgi:DinB superfamily